MAPTAEEVTETPIPYVEGQVLSLKDIDGKELSVTITKVYRVTISPVMEVQIRASGETEYQEAVLKMFDRRFGEDRYFYDDTKRVPHTEQREAAWQEYVRQGLEMHLLTFIENHRKEFRLKRIRYLDGYDDPNEPEWMSFGKHEAIFHWKAHAKYKTEIEAYHELKELQGRRVPQLISTVTLTLPSDRPDLPPIYFEIPGILLQKINGFTLSKMFREVDNPMLWKQITQDAIEAAKYVNRAGVINFDMRLQNVVVARLDDGGFQPFMIDFAQSTFRRNYKDTDNPQDPAGYEFNAKKIRNPGVIAILASDKAWRKEGCNLKLEFK
ncbi:uncharacterized protein F4822DRAFT_153757 [Hypoxylon trugodes]|uniref:uncharacterized protein n=1 Tax=Hypoxylon trugodes TaxID=326681 RepID=UPI0021943B20|nr:uncharacterized protein F4822DRAFT_153757 [Hypoxylon trugodes]KAI1390537.1 hypothetical protein F4822DRAFT_153757 [Hypoxylon trugodes]